MAAGSITVYIDINKEIDFTKEDEHQMMVHNGYHGSEKSADIAKKILKAVDRIVKKHVRE